jgi:hypothetical protein
MFSKVVQHSVRPSLARSHQRKFLQHVSGSRSCGGPAGLTNVRDRCNFHTFNSNTVRPRKKPWQRDSHNKLRNLSSTPFTSQVDDKETSMEEQLNNKNSLRQHGTRMNRRQQLPTLSRNQSPFVFLPSAPGIHSSKRIDIPRGGVTSASYSSSASPMQQAKSPKDDSTRNDGISSQRPSPMGVAESYHLLWTPSFAKNFGYATIGLLVFHNVVAGSAAYTMLTAFLSAAPFSSSISLSLLASSCCLFQILANVFAGTVGCLGLNTALGPSRPYFLSLLFYLTFVTSATSLPQILLRFSIAFLPEMLHTWNNRHKFLHPKNAPSIGSGMTATLEFDVPSMACVACINKIDSTLRNKGYENVDVTSWLDPALPKGGATKVTLTVESKEEAEAIGQSLVETFASIGFGGSSVSKLEVSKSAKSQS